MVDNSNKQLKDLSPYLKFFDFSKLTFKDPILLENATVFDSLRHIEKVVKSTLSDTKQISKHLKSSDLETTLRNNWHFVHDHIAYELDKIGVEQIRRPLRLIKDRKGDCDCFSTFFSSLLTHQGIEHSLRMTKYGGDWQHVYVIVPLKNGKYYTLDAVLHQFNQEEPYTKKYDKKMQMQVLNGLGNISNLGAISSLNFGSEFDDLQGLGYVEPNTTHEILQDFFARLKQSLINTRTILMSHQVDNQFLQEVNYLLDNFDHNISSALDHLTIPPQMGSLGDLGRFKFFNAIKTGVKKIGSGAKNLINNVGNSKFGTFVKNAGKVIMKFNPLAFAVRNGFYLALRTNALNIAGKLYYGSISEQEALSKGINLEEHRKLKNVFERVRKIVDKIGGKQSTFEKSLDKGVAIARRKGTVGLGHSLNGLGAAQAAGKVIQVIMKLLKKINWKQLLVKAKSMVSKNQHMMADTMMSSQGQNVYQNDVTFSQHDLDNLDVSPNFPYDARSPYSIQANTTATDDTSKSNKGLMIAGGIAVAGAVALFMLNKNTTAKKPLSGVRRATKKRPSTRRKTHTTRKVSVKI